MLNPQDHIFQLIANERLRQDLKWGPQNRVCLNRFEAIACLTEELGEVARAALEGHEQELEEELVQLAALCVAMLEHPAP